MQASSYTPSDAQVLTHIAFVAEFSLTCSNGASNVALYADLNGALVPVVRSQDAGGRFVRYLAYYKFIPDSFQPTNASCPVSTD